MQNQLFIPNPDSMLAAAKSLAKYLQAGDVVELIGDVGAGKTTFTKGLAVGLGIEEEVVSPTFTISRVYQGTSGLRLAHYDFYRLSEAGIMADELSSTIDEAQTVTVIEWGEVVADILPTKKITVKFEVISEAERQLTFWPADRLASWSKELR